MPLYALGSNSSYQLSLSHTNDTSIPSLTTLSLPPSEHPIKIVAGANHTLLLTNTGTLYTTGANKYGQCMTPPCDTVQGFLKVDGKWKDCAATWEGSIAVMEDGSLWSFGKIKNHDSVSGSKVLDEGVEWVSGGVQHFVALTKNGLMGYGDGRKGQLGTITQKPVSFPYKDFVKAACGKEFTCLLKDTGDLKIETTSKKYNITSIPPHSNIKSITASWTTIALLDISGNITSWGRSDHGQHPPPLLPAITQLASGSEHFIAISNTSKVYAWGWNEHGNCARSDREDVTSIHEIILPEDEKPIYVAAGCGTSWIWTTKR
jgi:protein ATS1